MSETNPKITQEAKSPWFDPITAILMALTSLGTAWCSYESVRWSDLSRELGIEADRLERLSSSQHLEGLQIEAIHVRGWMEVVDAHLNGNEKAEKFYTERFGDELKPAYDKWMALKPYENASAPPHPFVPGLYQLRYMQEVKDHKTEAGKLAKQSISNTTISSNYLGNTVILAIVLFCIGMVEKFDRRRLRWASFAFAGSLLIYAMVRIAFLPII